MSCALQLEDRHLRPNVEAHRPNMTDPAADVQAPAAAEGEFTGRISFVEAR